MWFSSRISQIGPPSRRRRGSVGRAPSSNRKVVKPWYDFQCGSASLCLWKRRVMLFPNLETSSLQIVTKDTQTEQLLCWSGMTDTEHSTTSGSNEEDRPGSWGDQSSTCPAISFHRLVKGGDSTTTLRRRWMTSRISCIWANTAASFDFSSSFQFWGALSDCFVCGSLSAPLYLQKARGVPHISCFDYFSKKAALKSQAHNEGSVCCKITELL